ncbi:MAG: dihydrofolate reductase [Bdellovibrionales bacterium]|nr:dihydrofolate reductase [Bdellovibrionales bacterium]
MIVSMVVAQGPKGEIGLNNKLLWHISEDLKNFKKITTGKMVVMGRKTYESIGKPLPNRANVVLTRDQNFAPDGVIVAHDPMMVFDLGLEAEEDLGLDDFEMMVIGGGEVYNFFMPYTQKIYLSEVNYDGPADVFFPQINYKEWEVEKMEKFQDFTFKILNRI